MFFWALPAFFAAFPLTLGGILRLGVNLRLLGKYQ
jgi:hypothetical protein